MVLRRRHIRNDKRKEEVWSCGSDLIPELISEEERDCRLHHHRDGVRGKKRRSKYWAVSLSHQLHYYNKHNETRIANLFSYFNKMIAFFV